MIACFSASVKFAGSFTATFAGLFNSAPGVWAFSLTTLDAGIIVSFPSASFTTTVPSSLTSIWPSVKPLFAAITAALTLPFSVSSRLSLFATSVSVGKFIVADTVLSFPIVFGVSPCFVTVTLPSLSTAIWSSVRPGFAFLTASLIACFSASVKFAGSFTATFAGSFNSAPGVASPTADTLLLVSFAVAVTFSPALILSFGSVTAPVSLSIVIDVSVPSGSFHSPFSLLTSSVWSCPSWSLYVIVTLFVSASVGGVTFKLPSSFASTFGAPGAVVSLAFTLAVSEIFSPAFATALTSASFFNLFAGKVISPVFSSTVISLSVFSGNFHLPFVFVAVNVVSVSLPAGVYLTSSTLALSSAGLTLTLPSFAALRIGFLSFSTTVSACASCPVLPFFSTVTEPSFATTISLASSPSPSLFASTAATTFCFSSLVNEFLLATSVLVGATNFRRLSVSLISSTVFSGVKVAYFPSLIKILVSPLGSTSMSASVSPMSGLAFLTSSLTCCFSASVSFVVSPTLTFSAGGLTVFPSLLNGFTVSSDFKVPVLLPSLTVTLPLLSTLTVGFVNDGFASLTFWATSSFSFCVKLAGFFTSTFSAGLFKSRIVSFCTTVLSAVIVPTLPPWLIFTVPSASTVISASVKFLFGLASLIASLTACFSLSVNAFALSTLTGSFGGLKLFWTSFCFTVLSGAKVPVLPSLVFTVTVPSSATVMSAFVKVGLALITASLTLSISSDVKDLVSFTSTGVGSANFKSSVAVFSQTAYTVLGASTFFRISASAVLASFVAAQPLNSYPSLLGSVGFATLSPSAFTVVCSLPSVNFPPLASNVTDVSSE